mmetsp:Transcript_17434/g.43485  ORF Transcript_17434/g.43485 Transcript_17434/m.43485 type:complete len:201 (+) Transcript_17434:1594-2196(+)
MQTTITKMSIIDHFANRSSHIKKIPRVDIDILDVGMNHNAIVKNCFVYGQIPEKSRIRSARAFPPAFHKSMVVRAMAKSKKSSTLIVSPAIFASMYTVAPRLRCPLRNRATLPRIISGIPQRIRAGISPLRNIESVVAFKPSSKMSFSRCFCERCIFFSLEKSALTSQRLCLRLALHLTPMAIEANATIKATAILPQRIR